MKKSNTLIILRGLPACGKSTYSMQLVKQGYIRVSKSDLNIMLTNGYYNNDIINYIDYINNRIIYSALEAGFNVVSDSCNLAFKEVQELEGIATSLNCETRIIDLSEPLEVCLERDLNRTIGRVGRDYITKLYNKYYSNGKINN